MCPGSVPPPTEAIASGRGKEAASPLFLSSPDLIIRIGAAREGDTSIRDLSLEAGHLNVSKTCDF